MADTDQILKILIQVQAQLADLDKTKKGIEDLKGSITKFSEVSLLLKSTLGALIPTSFVGALTGAIAAVKAFNAEQDQLFEAMARSRAAIRAMQDEILATQDALIKMTLIKTQPLTASIQMLQQELIRLKTEQALVTRGTEEGEKAFKDYGTQISNVTTMLTALNAVSRQRVALLDAEKLVAARAFGTKEDIEQARRGLLYNQILEQRKALNLDISDQTIKNRVDEVLLAEEQDKVRAEAEREKDTRESISPLLKDQATMLQNIRQTQQLISENPFMGADAKQAALLVSSRDEMRNIANAIEATESALKGSGLDATQYEQLEQRLQQLQFRFKQLGQDMQTMSFGGGLRAELTQWANSFGTTAQQVGKTIEATIGASLQAVNQLLVTGKFDAQALLQQLVMLGLQLVEQMILQRIMGAINAAANVGQAAATGPAVAALWAPAATAATIATQGAAALQAPAAVAGALAAIMGTLVIAHEGGPIRRRRMHGGGLAFDEVPIIAQEGEIMIQRSVAQQPGMMDYLLGLNAGMFHGGGFIAGRRYHRGGGGMDVGSNVFGPDSPFGGRGHGGGFRPPIDPDPIHDPNAFPPDLPIDRTAEEGPSWAMEGHDPGASSQFFSRLLNWGYSPPGGASLFGPTQSPTFWVNYPGVGPVAMAIPVSGWTSDTGTAALHHMGVDIKPSHRGGLISRFHSGGAVGGGGKGGAGVHIYAFTDLKQLTKHMASRDGQKIIFDTVKGRRIDLGMK